LAQLNANYKTEVEKLRSLIEQRKSDIESLTAQNEDLRKFCEKLTRQSQSQAHGSNITEVEQLNAQITEL